MIHLRSISVILKKHEFLFQDLGTTSSPILSDREKMYRFPH